MKIHLNVTRVTNSIPICCLPSSSVLNYELEKHCTKQCLKLYYRVSIVLSSIHCIIEYSLHYRVFIVLSSIHCIIEYSLYYRVFIVLSSIHCIIEYSLYYRVFMSIHDEPLWQRNSLYCITSNSLECITTPHHPYLLCWEIQFVCVFYQTKASPIIVKAYYYTKGTFLGISVHLARSEKGEKVKRSNNESASPTGIGNVKFMILHLGVADLKRYVPDTSVSNVL